MQGKGRCVDGLSPVVKEVYTWALGVGNVNNGVEEGAKVYTIEIARNSILRKNPGDQWMVGQSSDEQLDKA